jgi:hypothetical protein
MTISVQFFVATQQNRRKAQLSMNMLFCVIVQKSVLLFFWSFVETVAGHGSFHYRHA